MPGPGGALTVSEVAELVGGRLEGDGTLLVSGVAPIDEAGSDELGLLAIERYLRYEPGSRCGALLVASRLREQVVRRVPTVTVDEPYPALVRLLAHFHPERAPEAGIHPTAVIGRGVELGRDVAVGAYAVLEADVVVGSGCRIGPHAVVGRGSALGSRTTVHAHVVIYPDSHVGSDVILHAGVRVGSDGFGYTPVGGEHRKIPQVGRAVIEDGVEIGANSTIDRGSLGDTVVGSGTKIDNLVQIAHNVKVGAGSLLAALVGIAGSTRIGKGVWLGGRASAINHLDIGDEARVTFGSTVTRDVAPGETVSGYPARPHREELRRQARLGRLDRLVARLEALESRVGAEAGPRTGDGDPAGS